LENTEKVDGAHLNHRFHLLFPLLNKLLQTTLHDRFIFAVRGRGATATLAVNRSKSQNFDVPVVFVLKLEKLLAKAVEVATKSICREREKVSEAFDGEGTRTKAWTNSAVRCPNAQATLRKERSARQSFNYGKGRTGCVGNDISREVVVGRVRFLQVAELDIPVCRGQL
jgi:hypothetical protein